MVHSQDVHRGAPNCKDHGAVPENHTPTPDSLRLVAKALEWALSMHLPIRPVPSMLIAFSPFMTNLRKQRILIVEDEPSILDNIAYSLETEGFDPVGCTTGGDALGRFDEGFDLAVLDVGLPDVSGFELCKEIRKTSRLPIIFLTARASELDRIVGLEIGGDDYMVKPFSPRELSARVKAVLRRCGEPEPIIHEPTPSGLPLQIDDERIQVTYYSEILSLSSTEFRLLRLFARHPGRVYTRTQLMNSVWEEPEAAMERTVDAHIKSLRAKMKAVKPEIDPIETHRGMGYALKERW